MNVIRYKTNEFELEISLDAKGIAEIRKDGEALDMGMAQPEIYAAVIALALTEYESGIVHDEESNVITLVQQPTIWNAKSYGMNGIMKKNK